jgi:hypothetical protein
MNDLRRDINEVFATQQAQMGDVSGASNRMLRAATGGRRVNRQLWTSVAGVALVLIAASAVGVSIAIRGLHSKNVTTNHPSPTPIVTPTATPAPTPMSQLLQVPATTPVILFHDPADENQMDGITWDGSARGRVTAGPEVGMGFSQNPAGTLYGWTGYIRNRAGAVVMTLPANTKGFGGTWADDGQHLCGMVSESPFGQPGGKPTTLQVTAIGQASRNVVQVGRAYEQTSIGVVACSIEKDRAVIVQSGGQGMSTAQFWVVQISTGRIIWTKSYPLDGSILIDIRSSRDGQFIAEVKYTDPAAAGATTIYGPSGAVAGHVSGRVAAFSWDASLAVLGAYSGPVSVVRWRDGTVVWSGPAGGAYYDAMPEPGGQRIAVSVLDPTHPQTSGFPPRNVYAVGPDGQAIELLTNVK